MHKVRTSKIQIQQPINCELRCRWNRETYFVVEHHALRRSNQPYRCSISSSSSTRSISKSRNTRIETATTAWDHPVTTYDNTRGGASIPQCMDGETTPTQSETTCESLSNIFIIAWWKWESHCRWLLDSKKATRDHVTTSVVTRGIVNIVIHPISVYASDRRNTHTTAAAIKTTPGTKFWFRRITTDFHFRKHVTLGSLHWHVHWTPGLIDDQRHGCPIGQWQWLCLG